MNKRDFIVHGGGALLAGAVCLPAMARPSETTLGDGALADQVDPSHGQPVRQQDWRALLGLTFDTQTSLGRPLQLVLSEVGGSGAAPADTVLEQFTVTLQGPRALPLQAGMHWLHHAETGPVPLYLEPVAHGDQISYDAHFSLMT
jgi:hypothetical protein